MTLIRTVKRMETRRNNQWPRKVLRQFVAPSRVGAWSVLVGLFMTGVFLAGTVAPADAQVVDPRIFGFDIPMGNLRHPATSAHVITHDDEGEPVVAELHVGVGEFCIVRFPDGHLVARRSRDVQRTERPFQPLGGEEMEELYREKFPDFQIRRSQRHLFVFNTSENFANTAMRILESMYDGVMSYMQNCRVQTKHADTLLVVIMFSSEQELREFQRLSPDVVAFYDPRSNHVVLREPRMTPDTPIELAVSQALATIAHEGAHQVLANIGVHQRLAVWPMWLAEGLAEYLAPTVVDQRMRWAGAGRVNQWRMFELEQYFQGRGLDAVPGEMLQQTISANQLTSTGYATAWSLTHYLAKHERAAWNAFLRKCSEIRPLEGATQLDTPGVNNQNLAEFRDAFGNDLPELERKLAKHLERLHYSPPFANRTHYLAAISVPAGRRVTRRASVFLSKEMAQRWQEETVRGLAEEKGLEAQRAIQPFPNRAAAEAQMKRFLGMP